jgi:hypothetical protein
MSEGPRRDPTLISGRRPVRRKRIPFTEMLRTRKTLAARYHAPAYMRSGQVEDDKAPVR